MRWEEIFYRVSDSDDYGITWTDGSWRAVPRYARVEPSQLTLPNLSEALVAAHHVVSDLSWIDQGDPSTWHRVVELGRALETLRAFESIPIHGWWCVVSRVDDGFIGADLAKVWSAHISESEASRFVPIWNRWIRDQDRVERIWSVEQRDCVLTDLVRPGATPEDWSGGQDGELAESAG